MIRLEDLTKVFDTPSGRLVAADPPVMSMDKPSGAVDPINREAIQDEILKMHGEPKKTIMFVSHDIDEAVKMGNRIAILRAGRIERYDAPDRVLAHPANPFVADFVGVDRTLKLLRLVTVEQVADADAQLASRRPRMQDALVAIRRGGARRAVVLDGDRGPVDDPHRGDGHSRLRARCRRPHAPCPPPCRCAPTCARWCPRCSPTT